jgi:TonB family protein
MKLRKMTCVFALCCVIFGLGTLFMTETLSADQEIQKPISNTGPYFVGQNGVTNPVPLIQPLPPYTTEARNARAEGVVVLYAIIRKDGSVDAVKIIKGLGYGLDESAIDTVASKWRFKPGTQHGVPVDVIANIEVRFKLFDPLSLLAIIIEPHWERSPDGPMNGTGYGNLREGNSVRGFTYTCSCKGQFDIGLNTAKWIEQRSRVEITSYKGISAAGVKIQEPCELKVTMQDVTYELIDGAMIKHPIEITGQEKR